MENKGSSVAGSQPACPRPCKECPWLTANHGKPHLDNWYTEKNRRRLWAKLKRGDSMSCHKTDPENPVPKGVEPVPSGTPVHECTGALILQQREVMLFQKHCEEAEAAGAKDGFKRYKVAGGAMTRGTLAYIVQRALFGGTPLVGGPPMSRPNLNEPVSR